MQWSLCFLKVSLCSLQNLCNQTPRFLSVEKRHFFPSPYRFYCSYRFVHCCNSRRSKIKVSFTVYCSFSRDYHIYKILVPAVSLISVFLLVLTHISLLYRYNHNYNFTSQVHLHFILISILLIHCVFPINANNNNNKSLYLSVVR